MSTGPAGRHAFWRSPIGLALCVFLALGAFYLWVEHRAHVLGWLPLLVPLLFCLCMHFFMHRRHGGHGGPKGGA